MKARALIFVLSLALGGCVMGPKYQRPATAVPPEFRGAAPNAGPESVADTKWFDLFQDDTLKQLVGTALQQNFDLRIAAERVLEARAQYGITRGGLLPALDVDAGFTSSRSSSVGSARFVAPGTNLSSSFTQVGAALSWELDLWGRVRRLSEAARAEYLATDEARHGVTVSLISDVMTNYFALRERDLELEIARSTRDIAQDNLRLIQLRKDRGAASDGGSLASHS